MVKKIIDEKSPVFRAKKSRMVLVILVAVTFLAGAFFLAHAFRGMRGHGSFAPSILRDFHGKKIGTEDIRGWMTFDFLNRSFSLPSDYLRKELGVSDRKYPDLTIDNWAKNAKENPETAVARIKKLIENFR